MAKRARDGDRDVELMKGGYEWLTTIERSHRLRTRVELTPTERRGVFSVKALAETLVSGKPGQTVCSVTAFYPNGDNQTLEGLILALALQLDRMVDSWVLDAPGVATAAQNAG
jgi:hypothetical protein